MKRILSILFMFAIGVPAYATTWFIRTDGGTPAQCSGQVDAAYSATVTNKACAFGDARYLAFTGTYTVKPVMLVQGGDTVKVGAGQFRLGYNGPQATDHDGLAIAGNPFSSPLPAIPSGTAAVPTKIIGAGSTLTQLYGGYGAGAIINLSGSSFVQISGLEITDHGSCTRVGAGYGADVVPCSSSFPLSDYAAVGISTDVNTHDITLSDLNIHGLTADGIRGPIGGLVTVDHVRLGFNGSAGWDFDDGSGTKSVNNPSVVASYLTVEGSGCNEEYPLVHAFPAQSCFDQGMGGYGDGIATPNTPLNFTCDHCTVRYNTQDGLDLLHTSGSVTKVANSTSYGNEGQQWKLGAMAVVDFENNTWVHSCNRMSATLGGNSTYFKYLNTFCRAAGDGFGLNVMEGGSYTLRNNSYAGYGSTTYDISCSGTCVTPNIVFENNLHVGYKNPADGQYPGVFYYEPGMLANPFKSNTNNIYFQMRTVPAGGVATDPRIKGEPAWVNEASLDTVDFALTAASVNAVGQGTNGTDIGATGIASVATGPPNNGGTVTPPPPPPVTTPTTMTISLPTLVCTLNGSQYVCVPKTP
jgi:hypothetical protein